MNKSLILFNWLDFSILGKINWAFKLTLTEKSSWKWFFIHLLQTFFIVFLYHSLPFLYARLQTGRIMVWWCPSVRVSVRLSVHPTLRPSGSPPARFPQFSHTCFNILSWNFAHDFVLMYYRSSSSVVTLCQFLKELCLFWNIEYR